MVHSKLRFFTVALIFAAGVNARSVVGQTASSQVPLPSAPESFSQALPAFKESEIKFHLRSLMALLRDRNHEGWVLTAYPDPNTGLPLIGAGFSLTVGATDHPQYDQLNPNSFFEPSSAELWQAAGLDPERLRQILEEFHQNMEALRATGYHRRLRGRRLRPQLSEDEATQLLRVSALQSVLNARAYCRNFDRLSGPAQMALSQLAFQMGVNLDKFVEFLSELNGDTSHRDLSRPDQGNIGANDAEHWRNVQITLIDSQWARRYTVRAITVIAMFDPEYAKSPRAAEARIAAVLLPPAPAHHRRTSAHHADR